MRTRLSFNSRPATLSTNIVLRLTGEGAVYVQCKTRPGLETRPDSHLATVIAQLVRFLVDTRTQRGSPDPIRVAAILAIADNAPRTLDHLEEGCRAFDNGGDWSEVVGRVAENQRNALDIFANHARVAWRAATGSDASDRDLVDLARLFRIRRFGVDTTSGDWREASNLVGSRLFGREDAGGPPTLALLNTVRQLIRSGAAADRAGLVRALRAAGHADTRAPGFDEDVEALRKYSKEECKRLARHTRLPIGESGIPLSRECLPSLNTAIRGGSLLVIGEPGAGKTGALVALAAQLVKEPHPSSSSRLSVWSVSPNFPIFATSYALRTTTYSMFWRHGPVSSQASSSSTRWTLPAVGRLRPS